MLQKFPPILIENITSFPIFRGFNQYYHQHINILITHHQLLLYLLIYILFALIAHKSLDQMHDLLCAEWMGIMSTRA